MRLRPTKIPDGAAVVSQLHLLPQEVRIDYAPLQPYLEEARKYAMASPEQFLKDVANLTVRTLKPDNYLDWVNVKSREPRQYSLDECIKMRANSCFQRSVFYAWVMDQLGVDAWPVQGRVVETGMEKLSYGSRIAPLFDGQALGLKEGDFEEAHLWDIARSELQPYLVDASCLVEGEPVVFPIDWSGSPRDTFSMKLPDGRTRHYLMQGAVEIRH